MLDTCKCVTVYKNISITNRRDERLFDADRTWISFNLHIQEQRKTCLIPEAADNGHTNIITEPDTRETKRSVIV